jgi:hypothetical protein
MAFITLSIFSWLLHRIDLLVFVTSSELELIPWNPWSLASDESLLGLVTAVTSLKLLLIPWLVG